MSAATSSLLVVSDDTGKTHLVGHSPTIPGSRPNDRDVLCGAAFASDSTVAVVDVDCGECLIASQPFWCLPSWNEAQLP